MERNTLLRIVVAPDKKRRFKEKQMAKREVTILLFSIKCSILLHNP